MGSQGVKFFCSTCKIGVEGCVESGYALLLCGHRIRLDSFMISAFIVKGEVECGNCRKAEEGQWLILDRLWPSPEYGVDNSDILGYASDLTPPGSAPFPGYSVHADAVSKDLSHVSWQVIDYPDIPAHATSFPNGFDSFDSLMEHPYPDSVARAALRAEAVESYILEARNQKHVGSFSEQPQDGSAGQSQTFDPSFPNGFGSLDSLMEHPYPDSVARAAMRAQALESYILQARNQRHVGSFSEQPQDGSA